jgi:hypothetical protein
MKKCECDLLFGTVLAFFGLMLAYVIQISLIVAWIIIIAGKLIVILSVMEYVDTKRAIKGYDLTKDNKIRKYARKIRRKYRY